MAFSATATARPSLSFAVSCWGWFQLQPPPHGMDKSDYRDLYEELIGRSLRECPVCHVGADGRERRPRASEGLWALNPLGRVENRFYEVGLTGMVTVIVVPWP